jgi:acetyl-CoA carboxylase carboxyl transferase subunit alpha
MLQNSTYSVISPEGCASILWKSADKAQLAAEAMGITSEKLKDLGLIDEVIPEPLGGAHRDPETTAANIKQALLKNLTLISDQDMDHLLTLRYERLMGYGSHKE